MQVTRKEVSAFNTMLKDTFAPSANDNYNEAHYGMKAARFYEMHRFMTSNYGMRCFWPSKITQNTFKLCGGGGRS